MSACDINSAAQSKSIVMSSKLVFRTGLEQRSRTKDEGFAMGGDVESLSPKVANRLAPLLCRGLG